MPGPRAQVTDFRNLYLGRVRNPLSLVLVSAERLQLSTEQADSIAMLIRSYNNFAYAAWDSVAHDLTGLGVDYDLDVAWKRVIRGYTSVVERLLDHATHTLLLLTPTQRARLTVSERRMLDTLCIRSAHPAGGPGGRPGGAGALGISSLRGPGC
jgi:hypothetical protein